MVQNTAASVAGRRRRDLTLLSFFPLYKSRRVNDKNSWILEALVLRHMTLKTKI